MAKMQRDVNVSDVAHDFFFVSISWVGSDAAKIVGEFRAPTADRDGFTSFCRSL